MGQQRGVRASVRSWVAAGVITCVVTAAVPKARADVQPPDSSPAFTAPASASPPPFAPASPKVHRRRRAAVATGAVIFGLSWGLAVFLGAAMIGSGCCQRSMAIGFFAPVVGPIASGPAADQGLMLFWSAAQLGGVILFAYGMRGEDVPASAEPAAPRAAGRGPTFQIAPMLARDAGGLTAIARW